jgi:hypothetical protein
MNIQTVASNLRNTIAGKEHMLDSHKRYLRGQGITGAETIASETIVKFLEINIGELKRILQDVESCVAKDVEQSWRDNPDRSGGQFTQDEIDNATRWN